MSFLGKINNPKNYFLSILKSYLDPINPPKNALRSNNFFLYDFTSWSRINALLS